MMARVALGEQRERADFAGAMQEMSGSPLPAVLLVVLAVGMLGYATWRLMQGIFDLESEGSDPVGLLKRGTYLGIGLLYLFFAVYALGILGGWSTREGEVQDWTATILGWPMGRWIIGAVGAAVLAGGASELWFAVSRRYRSELGHDELSRFERISLMTSGGVGHAGRALVYGAAGVFAIRAALDFDADEARGMAATVRELAEQPYGDWIVAFGALGFLAYGLYYCLIARHHHLPNEGMLRGRGGGSGSGGEAGS
jgi:hypothetical protein